MPRKATYDRDDLIDRARILFWRQGWAGTSMKDLEGVLKLRPGSFYAAFGSKDALYGLALDRYAANGTARLEALADEHPPLDALKAYVRWIAVDGEGAGRACMLAKTLLEVGPAGNPLAARATAHLARAEGAFADLFQAARAQGAVAPHRDPARLARRFQSDLMGMRIMLERADSDARTLASEMTEDLDALAA